MDVEDIILAHDRRGMTALRPFLAADFCEAAARFLLQHSGPTLIVTGFYILNANAPETDGPPGALALGRALTALGRQVVYVTDDYTAPLLRALTAGSAEVVAFPLGDDTFSRRHASHLLAMYRPALLIAIERCGLTAQGTYLNMRGKDISATTARVDHLFLQHPYSIGIGDGGNEIGMGKVAAHIPGIASLPRQPALTATTHLVIASVANWGAYGLLTSLSRFLGRNLLVDTAAETELIRQIVASGAVDGTTGSATPTIDGFTLEENAHILCQLHQLLDASGAAR